MNFLDGSLFPENHDKLVITAAPYGPEWMPADFPEDIPITIKEHFEDRPATGTGVYTTGIQVGSTGAAALAVPLAGWLAGGWRGALIAISIAALLSLVAWVVLTWGEGSHTAPSAW